MITFVIPGQPVAKGRPRFARRGAHVVAYTPEKTMSYESLVKTLAAEQMNALGLPPSAKPISLEIVLRLQIPASWSKKRREMARIGQIRATKKPDADNVLKGIKDACNGIVWRDDSQVINIGLHKEYSETPFVRVRVMECLGESA